METSVIATRPFVMEHRRFSIGRVSAIASNSLLELTRQKIFYFLLLFAALIIGSSAFMARLTFQQEFQVLKDIALGAMSIFTSLLAILSVARMLPQEIEEKTIYTILAKPVPRFEYLLGKLLSALLFLGISTLVMTLLFFAVLYLREQGALAETTRQLSGASPQQISDAINEIRGASFNRNLIPGIAIIYLKSALLAALTLFISTFATSNIFVVVTSVFVYFIGHLQGVAREYWLAEQGGGNWLSRAFLALVALIFPDLQLFNFADDVALGAAIPHLLLVKTILLGGFYIVLYLLLATAVFSGREL